MREIDRRSPEHDGSSSIHICGELLTLSLELPTLRFQSSAFSPTFFVGEKVAKPDEGAFSAAARLHEKTVHQPCVKENRLSNLRPPSSAFGTFSPRKGAGGRRRSIQTNAEIFRGLRNTDWRGITSLFAGLWSLPFGGGE
jgi:hypothetical protein